MRVTFWDVKHFIVSPLLFLKGKKRSREYIKMARELFGVSKLFFGRCWVLFLFFYSVAYAVVHQQVSLHWSQPTLESGAISNWMCLLHWVQSQRDTFISDTWGEGWRIHTYMHYFSCLKCSHHRFFQKRMRLPHSPVHKPSCKPGLRWYDRWDSIWNVLMNCHMSTMTGTFSRYLRPWWLGWLWQWRRWRTSAIWKPFQCVVFFLSEQV